MNVKVKLFRSYCLGLWLYGIASWNVYKACSILKFQSCCNRCLKLFFGYRHRDGMIQALWDNGLRSFFTVLYKCRQTFLTSWSKCTNSVIVHIRGLALITWLLYSSSYSLCLSLCLFSCMCVSIFMCLCFFSWAKLPEINMMMMMIF